LVGKSALGQLELLKNIGVSQMEKELEEKVKAIQKSSAVGKCRTNQKS
jgi:hypothetical protein